MATGRILSRFLSTAAFSILAIVLLGPQSLARENGGAQSSARAKAKDLKIHGYALSQRSRAEGAIEVYATKSAVRLEIVKTGFMLVATAPWRDVTMYCTRTHNYYKCPFKQLRNPYLKLRNMYDGCTMADLPLLANGADKVCGLDTRVFMQKRDFEMAQIKRRLNNLVAARAPKRFKYQTTAQLKCDPEVGFAMSRFYALPETTDIPLELTYKDCAENLNKELTTASCKKTEICGSSFSLPSGFTQVKDPLQLIVPDNKDGELDMMMFGTKDVELRHAAPKH